MSHENRKAVVQLVRDLVAKGLNVHFELQMLAGYEDRKFRKRAVLSIHKPKTFGWSFVSRNYKTNENAGGDAYEQPYVAIKAYPNSFEEREAKSLIKDIEGTLGSFNKIAVEPAFVNEKNLLFLTLQDVFVSRETLLLKALASGITDEEAENFGVKEDICL